MERSHSDHSPSHMSAPGGGSSRYSRASWNQKNWSPCSSALSSGLSFCHSPGRERRCHLDAPHYVLYGEILIEYNTRCLNDSTTHGYTHPGLLCGAAGRRGRPRSGPCGRALPARHDTPAGGLTQLARTAERQARAGGGGEECLTHRRSHRPLSRRTPTA